MAKKETTNEPAKQQDETLTPTVAEGVSETMIAEKVQAGLTREQALQVLQAQAESDQATKQTPPNNL
jgi:hypothetical protein